MEGTTYPLASFVCCCLAPDVTVVAGNVSTRPSCDEVCATAGFEHCADFYDWQSGSANGASNGGIMMDYVRASTGSDYYLVSSCAHVPATTINAAGASRDLSGYSCACY